MSTRSCSPVTRVLGAGRAALGGFPGGLLQSTIRTGAYAVEGPRGVATVDLDFCETPFADPDHFRVIGLPLLQGRGFDTAQHAGPSHELVVNQALAQRLWPNGDALGAKLRVGDGARATWLTVVGIAGDLRLPGSTFGGDLFKLQMYRPASEAGEMVSSVVLRVREGTSTAALQATLDRAARDAGVGATVQSVDAAESTFDRRVLARPRFALVLFGLFTAIALAVSAIGLYAIVAYAVTQRTREIGVRVALGAAPSAVTRLVLGASTRLVALGGCIGLFAAYGATRALTSFLGGMSPSDPVAFGGGGGVARRRGAGGVGGADAEGVGGGTGGGVEGGLMQSFNRLTGDGDECTGAPKWIGSIYRKMMAEAPAFGATLPVMPETSRFRGIVISMPFSDHEPPHFHARYGDHKISVGIWDGRVTGQFPR